MRNQSRKGKRKMPIALTPNKIINYVLKGDKALPKSQQTVFKLRALTGAERFHIQDMRFSVGVGTANQEIVLRGLSSWENFKDAQGSPIPFVSQVVDDGREVGTEENLSYLSEKDLMELVVAIRTHDELDEDEIKNSESPDTLSQEN